MNVDASTILQELIRERQFAHEKYETKLRHAWQLLLFALAIPVAAGSLQVPNIQFANARFIMLAACLVGNAAFAYAMYLYREVYSYQRYLEQLEDKIRVDFGIEQICWESSFNPYKEHEQEAVLIFGTLTFCMVIASTLSVLYAADLLGVNQNQPALPLYVWAPTAVAYLALFFASFRLVRGMVPSLMRCAVD